MGSNKKVVKGWNKIGGDFYYFNYPGGSMTYNNTINGFYLEDSGKMVNGTGWLQDEGNWYYLYPKGSMTWDNTIDGYYLNDDGEWVPNDVDHVSYIFYQPGVESGDGAHLFDNQAKIEAEKYKNKYQGTEVVLVPVINPYDFKQKWNDMDDQSKVIDAVQIIFHGSINDDNNGNGAGFMYFEDEIHKDDPYTWWYRIATDKTVIPDQQKNEAILISDLDNKKMNELYFSSCNSANPDAENVASEFSKIADANKITGWDGGSVYEYNDKEPEKSEEVAGGEGGYDKFEIKFIDGCGSYLVPTETCGQPTWWKYVEKDEFGNPVRKREGKVIVK